MSFKRIFLDKLISRSFIKVAKRQITLNWSVSSVCATKKKGSRRQNWFTAAVNNKTNQIIDNLKIAQLQLVDCARMMTYGLEVAVNYALIKEGSKAAQNGDRDPANDGEAEALEAVFLYQLVEVHSII